jgi:hypothetical protein
MTLEARIDLIGERMVILVQRLTERGFVFERPDEILPGPAENTDEVIAEIENEIGTVPLALKLFWLRVGSVNFCGSHPDWEVDSRYPGFEGEFYPDPLIIDPVSVALAELDEFLSDREERLRCNFPYLIPIAPDFYHKADVSGGMWYNISVPAVADDPPLNDEWHKTTFISYLEEAIKWGGFPGLVRYPHHNWPVQELTKEF